MRNELIQILNEINDVDTIKRILLNMDSAGVHNVLSLLDYTKPETKQLWLSTYLNIMKN